MSSWGGQRWEPAGEPLDPASGQPLYGPPLPYAPVPYLGRPDPADQRPGLAVAAAVLAFIDAGLLILSGALLLPRLRLGARGVAPAGPKGRRPTRAVSQPTKIGSWNSFCMTSHTTPSTSASSNAR